MWGLISDGCTTWEKEGWQQFIACRSYSPWKQDFKFSAIPFPCFVDPQLGMHRTLLKGLNPGLSGKLMDLLVVSMAAGPFLTMPGALPEIPFWLSHQMSTPSHPGLAPACSLFQQVSCQASSGQAVWVVFGLPRHFCFINYVGGCL